MLNVRGVVLLTSLAAASPLVACAPVYTTFAAAYPVAYPAAYPVTYAMPAAVPVAATTAVPAVATAAVAPAVTPVYSAAPVTTVAPTMVVNRVAVWP